MTQPKGQDTGPEGALDCELAEENILLLDVALSVVGRIHADSVDGDIPPQLQGCAAGQLPGKRIQQRRLACAQGS